MLFAEKARTHSRQTTDFLRVVLHHTIYIFYSASPIRRTMHQLAFSVNARTASSFISKRRSAHICARRESNEINNNKFMVKVRFTHGEAARLRLNAA